MEERICEREEARRSKEGEIEDEGKDIETQIRHSQVQANVLWLAQIRWSATGTK